MAVRSRAGRHRSRADPLASRVGARIRRLREEAGFTFDAFVEEVGLGRGYVSELERGMVVPSVTSLDRVASALEVTVADLVVGTSAREKLFDVTRHLDARDVGALQTRAEELKAVGHVASERPFPFRVVSAAAARRLSTAVPMLGLRPAAEAWSPPQAADVEAWLVVPLRTRSKRGLFVARVAGASMEPTIPPSALCLFQRPWTSPRVGETGIFVRWETPRVGRFTLKEHRPLPADVQLGGGRPFARFVRVLAAVSA